eukprot:1158977-Pelagomonas_calceolata.AAC.1
MHQLSMHRRHSVHLLIVSTMCTSAQLHAETDCGETNLCKQLAGHVPSQHRQHNVQHNVYLSICQASQSGTPQATQTTFRLSTDSTPFTFQCVKPHSEADDEQPGQWYNSKPSQRQADISPQAHHKQLKQQL